MKALYHYELAQHAGVSPSTLRSWMRATPEIHILGYTPGMKVLPPSVVQCLATKYCIYIPT